MNVTSTNESAGSSNNPQFQEYLVSCQNKLCSPKFFTRPVRIELVQGLSQVALARGQWNLGQPLTLQLFGGSVSVDRDWNPSQIEFLGCSHLVFPVLRLKSIAPSRTD